MKGKYDPAEIKTVSNLEFDYSKIDLSRDGFSRNLTLAATKARDFARTLVVNDLPDAIAFRIFNGVMDAKYLEVNEFTLEDAVHDGGKLYESEADVVELLWRDGAVPVWINVSISDFESSCSIVDVKCGGRFSSDPSLLYHINEGIPPFHILGPALPPNHKHGKKFDLLWNQKKSIWRRISDIFG